MSTGSVGSALPCADGAPCADAALEPDVAFGAAPSSPASSFLVGLAGVATCTSEIAEPSESPRNSQSRVCHDPSAPYKDYFHAIHSRPDPSSSQKAPRDNDSCSTSALKLPYVTFGCRVFSRQKVQTTDFDPGQG